MLVNNISDLCGMFLVRDKNINNLNKRLGKLSGFIQVSIRFQHDTLHPDDLMSCDASDLEGSIGFRVWTLDAREYAMRLRDMGHEAQDQYDFKWGATREEVYQAVKDLEFLGRTRTQVD